ncbi:MULTISPECIES: polymer-forming cytoskeletal protein [Paenibacillus]|nr:polymer-forming cytoskeletal protein [Paenibacillus validus]
MESRNNLTVTGTGGAAGGLYKDIKVMGEADFNGDVDCLALKCSGTVKVRGGVKSTSCRINGTFDVSGDLVTGRATIHGRMAVEGNVKAQEIKSNGETTIRGHVAGDRIHLEGYFQIKGRCEAEQLRIKGIFKIAELVNADSVDLALHSRCQVKEIGGERIEVRRGTGTMLKKLLGSLFLPADYYEGTLTAESIEGDDVYVEYTQAEVIRGRNVVVGPGCRIGRIEYTNKLEHTAGSDVTDAVQI